jgi:hypothetical protein
LRCRHGDSCGEGECGRECTSTGWDAVLYASPRSASWQQRTNS